MKKSTTIIALIIIASVMAACGSKATPKVNCKHTTQAQIDWINDWIDDVDGSNYMVNGYTVESKDFEGLWIVGGMIHGPDIEEGVGPGIWAHFGDPQSPGMTFAINGFATEFSNAPYADDTNSGISRSTDGVDFIEDCFK